jgi:hypothetical protein
MVKVDNRPGFAPGDLKIVFRLKRGTFFQDGSYAGGSLKTSCICCVRVALPPLLRGLFVASVPSGLSERR